MGGIRKLAGNSVTTAQSETAQLNLEYPRLARRLRLTWWWGRVRRGLAIVGRAVLFAAALAFAVLSCSRAYGQLIHGLGSLTRV
jgi:hypothetical protein